MAHPSARSDRIWQHQIAAGKRRRAGRDQEGRQDGNSHPDRGRNRTNAQGDGADLRRHGISRRQGVA